MNSLAAVLFVGALSFGDVLSSYYHGPTAVPYVLHDGHIADTHEVAAAKSAHLATLSSQSHGHHDLSYHGHHGDSRYHGPIAVPHVLHDGHIADTHEVAAAKAEHFAAVAKARAHHNDYNDQYAAGYDHYSGASGAYHGYGAHGGYHGPLAKPVVLPSGYLVDTHEVAAIKHKHEIAHANQHHDYNGQYAAGYDHYSGASGAYHGYGAHGGYHGPLAKPVVLPSGYLADTHEVAAIKHKHEIAHANQHHDYNDQYAAGYDHYSGASGAYHVYGAHGGYHGPLAKPVVLPSGYLADTHEVAAIKHKHEIAHANQHHGHSNNSRYHYGH